MSSVCMCMSVCVFLAHSNDSCTGYNKCLTNKWRNTGNFQKYLENLLLFLDTLPLYFVYVSSKNKMLHFYVEYKTNFTQGSEEFKDDLCNNSNIAIYKYRRSELLKIETLIFKILWFLFLNTLCHQVGRWEHFLGKNCWCSKRST